MQQKGFNRICLALIFLFFCGTTLPQSNSWRGIRPLYSTRADVERILGKAEGKCNCIYRTANETVEISYATAKCEGEIYGWNVPKDTVLYFGVDIGKPYLLQKKTSDDFISLFSNGALKYINSSGGVVYHINPFDEINDEVDGISYFPTPKDSGKRCKGFPQFDLVSMFYEPFGEYELQNWSSLENGLDNLIIRVDENQGYTGYIIFYDGEGSSARGWAKINDYVNKRNRSLNRLKLINGGFRKNSEVALYLIPNKLPPPIPTPTKCCKNYSKERGTAKRHAI